MGQLNLVSCIYPSTLTFVPFTTTTAGELVVFFFFEGSELVVLCSDEESASVYGS